MEATATGAPVLEMAFTDVMNNGRFGVATYNGDMTLNDVNVSGTRNDDATCITDAGRRCNMAVAAWSSNLTWSG